MAFLRLLFPTRIKMAFLAPWLACVVVAVVLPRFDAASIAPSLAWPFLFFYLLGGILKSAAGRIDTEAFRRRSSLLACVLVAVDHAAKFAAQCLFVPGEPGVLIFSGFRVANYHNVHGTWVSSLRDSSPVILQIFLLTTALAVLSPFLHRFYVQRHRASFWSALAYSTFLAGNLSAAIDLGVRGLVVDYLYLPGLYAVDLKDVYLMILPSAIVVEALENPGISLRWRGWRGEFAEIVDLLAALLRFARAEVRRWGRIP